MSERNPYLEQYPSREGRKLSCEEWETLIAEALDGSLPANDSAVFEQHGRECVACAQMLEEARQGVAWLAFLEKEPELPAGLMNKILARTTGTQTPGLPLPIHGLPAVSPAWYRVALPVARRVIDPRLMMTAAMAFFSLALTLNLTGIKLSEIRLSDFRPSVLRTNLTRQYYSAKLQGTKYYENLRIVYEMEARVRDLKRSAEPVPPPPPQQKPAPSSRNGSGKRVPYNHNPGSFTGRRGDRQVAPEAEEGFIEAAEILTGITRSASGPGPLQPEAAKIQIDKKAWSAALGKWKDTPQDQAKRSLA
jgi:hypothetical protein